MSVQFSFWPALLLLPLLLLFAWWQDRRSVTDMTVGRRRAALAVRFLLLSLLTFALAGTTHVRQSDSVAVVFLVDSSRSMRGGQRDAIRRYLDSAVKSRRAVDQTALVTFAEGVHTQSSIGQPFDSSRLRDPGATAGTNIVQALRAARNELLDPSARGAGRRIVLLSDGNETADHSLPEAAELAADHILLDTVTIPLDLKREALVDRLVLPNQVKIGEPFSVRALVSSLTEQTVRLQLTRDGRATGPSRMVGLHRGKNVVAFDQSITRPGFFRYGVTLSAPEDTLPENNGGEGYVWVRGKPAVLYVADSSALTGFLRQALHDQSMEVDYLSPGALPANAADLQRYDTVFLSNVLASDLSQNQMLALQVACRDFGVGLGMVGGRNSFGAGYYRGTPIEEALPVTMDVKKQKRLPSVAVALVIEDLEVPSTVNMSIEAAKATIDNLEPIDQVGVLDCNGFSGIAASGEAVSPAGRWRIEMAHVTDRDGLKVKLQGLIDMGDPPTYDPYLLEAARVLNATDAKVKHIIFLGDGDAIGESTQGGTAANIKKIRDSGVTLSTITTGATDASETTFMAALAFTGGGQAYVADHPEDLPRLLLKDAETISQPPIVEEPFRPTDMPGDEIFQGIDWAGSPPLLGYNIANLKPTASLSLITHRKDPLFASWRYGLGRSVAFMSDDRARWAAPWLSWAGYSRFWAQAIRWTLRSFAPADYTSQVTYENGRGHIVVDALDAQGRYVNRLEFSARIAPPAAGELHASPSLDAPLRQIGPGRYEAWFDAPKVGTYMVNVMQKQAAGPASSSLAGLSLAYSPEYRQTESNPYLMAQLAAAGNGRANPAPGAIFGSDRPSSYAPTDIVPQLVLGALLLLPFDIAVRRLAADRRDVARIRAWLRRLLGRPVQAADPGLQRLLDRKATTAASMRAPEQPADRAAEQRAAVSLPPPAAPAGTSARAPAAPPSAEARVREPLPDGIQPPEADEPDAMARLMAAKRRARERQERKDEK